MHNQPHTTQIQVPDQDKWPNHACLGYSHLSEYIVVLWCSVTGGSWSFEVGGKQGRPNNYSGDGLRMWESFGFPFGKTEGSNSLTSGPLPGSIGSAPGGQSPARNAWICLGGSTGIVFVIIDLKCPRSCLGVYCEDGPQGHFTPELEDPWPLIFKMSYWWKMLRVSHFTLLELEGLSDQGSLNGWTNLCGVLNGMQWIMFHGPEGLASSPPQRGESKTKSGDHDTSKSHNSWFMLTYLVEGFTCGGW